MKVQLEAGAIKPTREYATDAGLDLYAMHGGTVKAHKTATFHTGTHVQLPSGTAGILQPKSGLMTRLDILTFGIVDEGYSGEVLVHMFNLGDFDYTVRAGDKISQMLVVPVRYEPIEVTKTITGGDRKEKGFGSSGR